VVGHSMGGMCEVVRSGSVTVDFFLPSLFFPLSFLSPLLEICTALATIKSYPPILF